MRNKIKSLLKLLLGRSIFNHLKYFRNTMKLKANYKSDYYLYKKHSSTFLIDTFEKKESEITRYYHSIEKGFLHEPIRHKFAKEKVVKLIDCLQDEIILNNINRIHIQAAIANLINYYEAHINSKIDISEFFPKEKYLFFKDKLNTAIESTKNHSKESFFRNTTSNFKNFANSRSSVRSFTGELIPIEKIQQVINLANSAPSVCNRQSTKIYLVENKILIDKIFNIQGGLKGYTEKLSQIIILTSDRSYFHTIGERNQLYVDGGIYTMNLLYALHYYKIGACPAHWAMPVTADRYIRELLNIPENIQIISLIAIGIPQKTFKTTTSLRRSYEENLLIVK